MLRFTNSRHVAAALLRCVNVSHVVRRFSGINKSFNRQWMHGAVIGVKSMKVIQERRGRRSQRPSVPVASW